MHYYILTRMTKEKDLILSVSSWSLRTVLAALCSVVCSSLQPPNRSHQGPLSTECSRQKYWSGLSFPPPGDLPVPGVKPVSLHWQADSLPAAPPGKPTTSGSINWYHLWIQHFHAQMCTDPTEMHAFVPQRMCPTVFVAALFVLAKVEKIEMFFIVNGETYCGVFM